MSVLYLPPYSPDLNPIEKMWSKMKAILRRWEIRSLDLLPDAIPKALACVSTLDCSHWFAASILLLAFLMIAIDALHLEETAPGKFRELPFLTGHVNFEAVIARAWKLGARRFVTKIWDVGLDSWKEDIQFACASMRRILGREVETARKSSGAL